MFTARKFLQTMDYDILAEEIRSDPIRLRKEFLRIAVNPKENYLLRLRSLRILQRYAQVFGLFTPLERQTLMMGFESEFPPKRLQKFGEMARCGSLGYIDRWLLFCYCIAVARITLNTTSDIVNSTREVYGGTTIGGTLERYLDTIESRKSDGRNYDQMEAG